MKVPGIFREYLKGPGCEESVGYAGGLGGGRWEAQAGVLLLWVGAPVRIHCG